MMTLRQTRLFLWGCAVLFLSAQAIAWGCPNCKDSLASDPSQAGLVRGLFWSILFLLSMPFLITAGLGSYFYWQIKRAQKNAALSAEIPSSPFQEHDESEARDQLEPVGA